jgi:hypothetical protein
MMPRIRPTHSLPRGLVRFAAAGLLVAAPGCSDVAEDTSTNALGEQTSELSSNGCENADPSGQMANVGGDYEIVADPQDPNGSLILASNRAEGRSGVVVVQIEGQGGKVVPNSLTTVADNYNGTNFYNGPEFVRQPSGALGLLFAGGGVIPATTQNPLTGNGVYGVFRSANRGRWNDFGFAVGGARLPSSSGLRLTSSLESGYPGGSPILGQRSYPMFGRGCSGICYAAMDSGTFTDVYAGLATKGLTVSAATQSPDDGTVFMIACKTSAPKDCGIYSATIDGRGGLVGSTAIKVATAPAPEVMETMRAIRHPATGSIVLFAGAGVWEQRAKGAQLTSIGKVNGPAGGHYRSEADATSVVLHYLVRSGASAGSYTVRVAEGGEGLAAESTKKIGTATAGAELIWLPNANRWALFSRSAGTFSRCWVAP